MPDPQASPELQNLEEFVNAIRTATAALQQQTENAAAEDQVAEEAVARGRQLMQDIETGLRDSQETLVAGMEHAEHEIGQTTEAAHKAHETDLPAAVHRLEEVPPALDGLVDPMRAELVASFKALESEGFEFAAGIVQGAATAIEAADDGGSGLQPFLELPHELHQLATDHQSHQQHTSGEMDQHTTALTNTSHECHGTAETATATWAHSAEALQQHCDQHGQEVRTLYTGWEQAEAPHGPAVDQAVHDAGTHLKEALDREDATVDHETAEAQTSLDNLNHQMSEGQKGMDEGESVVWDIAEFVLPELGVAKGVVHKIKELTDAL
jgi:hypothetical protein